MCGSKENLDPQLILLDCINKLPCLETLYLSAKCGTLTQILPCIIKKLSKTLIRFRCLFRRTYNRSSTSVSLQSMRCLSYTNLQIIQINCPDQFASVEPIVLNLPASLKLFIVDNIIPEVDEIENIFNTLMPVVDKSYAIEILDHDVIDSSSFDKIAVPEQLTVHFSIWELLNHPTILEAFLHIFTRHPLNNVRSLNFDENRTVEHYGEDNLLPLHHCVPSLECLIHCGPNVDNHSSLINLKELTINAAYAHRLEGVFSVRKLTLSDGPISTNRLDRLLQEYCQWPNLTDISFELDNLDLQALNDLSEVIDKNLNLKNVEIRNLNELFSSMMKMSDRSASILGAAGLSRGVYMLKSKLAAIK
eukprot:414825_1